MNEFQKNEELHKVQKLQYVSKFKLQYLWIGKILMHLSFLLNNPKNHFCEMSSCMPTVPTPTKVLWRSGVIV